MTDPAMSFEAYRPRLLGLAYRMLGSMAEAECGRFMPYEAKAPRCDIRLSGGGSDLQGRDFRQGPVHRSGRARPLTDQTSRRPGAPRRAGREESRRRPLCRRRIAGLPPGRHASLERPHVPEPLRLVPGRLTGGRPLGRSAAVEDDRLVPGQRARPGGQGGQRDRSFERHLSAPFVAVRAHQECSSRYRLSTSVLHAEPRDVRHGVPPCR